MTKVKKSTRISHPSNHQFFIRNFFRSVLLPYGKHEEEVKMDEFHLKDLHLDVIIRVVHIFNEITVTTPGPVRNFEQANHVRYDGKASSQKKRQYRPGP